MEFLEEKGRIYAVDANGKLLAEVTFPDDGNTAIIDHTFVDESLRGQGTASKLLRQAVDSIRRQGKKARPVCSYAAAWFEKHPEEKDLLEET